MVSLLGNPDRFEIFKHLGVAAAQCREDIGNGSACALFGRYAGDDHLGVTVKKSEQFDSGVSARSDNGDIQHGKTPGRKGG
jgi:hypothetical protein